MLFFKLLPAVLVVVSVVTGQPDNLFYEILGPEGLPVNDLSEIYELVEGLELSGKLTDGIDDFFAGNTITGFVAGDLEKIIDDFPEILDYGQLTDPIDDIFDGDLVRGVLSDDFLPGPHVIEEYLPLVPDESDSIELPEMSNVQNSHGIPAVPGIPIDSSGGTKSPAIPKIPGING